MRISKLKIPLDKGKHKGLKEIDMTKKPLGSVVALVGKNGAGKSRILEFVLNYFSTISSLELFNHVLFIPTSIKVNFNKTHFRSSQNFYASWLKALGNTKKTALESLNSHSSQILKTFKKLSIDYVKFIDNDKLTLIRSKLGNEVSFSDIINNSHFENSISNKKPSVNEFDVFNTSSTIDYLTSLTQNIIGKEFNLYLEHKDDPSKIKELIIKERSYQLFEKFQEYVQRFLGKKINYKQHTEGSQIQTKLDLDGVSFDLNQLSPGQKTLFAYAVMLFYMEINSNANIAESIIIIDEPEKHLHPEAQIELIKALKEIVSEKGQLWIATHSIPILSNLEAEEIIMVQDNSIIHPSRTTPGNSFNELMGLETHVQKLSSFINSISEWAYANFMTQCFHEPAVIFSENKNDPQFELFKEFVSKNSQFHLLDYGAGRGRIGHTLSTDESTNKIKYSAFEPFHSQESELNSVPNILSIYEEESKVPENSFEVVLLVNVLHEIHVDKWILAFETIKKCLKPNGYLLVVEDRFLPKGEKANEFGYLILDSIETKILLNTENSIELKLKDKKYKDRILFNAFRKDQINVTSKSIKDALTIMHDRTFDEIKKLRKIETKDIATGRKYANETQLHINCKLALETLK